jgi:predicted nucleic acid-binding protein
MPLVVVADSSYIVEGLLKDKSMFEGYYYILSPDYGLYEVLNAVWKHQVLLKKIIDTETILAAFFDLISAQRIRFVALEEATIRSAYALAVKTRSSLYDIIFIALAKELGVELKTLDKRQEQIFKKIRKP